MSVVDDIWLIAVVWLTLAAMIAGASRRWVPTLGLGVAWVTDLTMNQLIAPLASSLGGRFQSGYFFGGVVVPAQIPLDGLTMALVGLLSFALGYLIVLYRSRPNRTARAGNQVSAAPTTLTDAEMTTLRRIFLIGALAFIVSRLLTLSSIPTFGTLAHTCAVYIVIAPIFWFMLVPPRRRTIILTFLLIVGLLTTGVGFDGFLAQPAVSVIIILSALFVRSRLTVRTALIALMAIYVGLSIFIAYMQVRVAVRAITWSGAGLSSRSATPGLVLGALTPFNPFNPQQDLALERLDLVTFQGLMKERLDQGEVTFANGATFAAAALAFVPRVIWPDKPVLAGGNSIVSGFTGLQFDSKTSIGTGEIFEAYGNFGWVGEVGILFFIGVFLAYADSRGRAALQRRNLYIAVLLATSAIPLIDTAEYLAADLGSVVVSVALAFALQRSTHFFDLGEPNSSLRATRRRISHLLPSTVTPRSTDPSSSTFYRWSPTASRHFRDSQPPP